MSLGTQENSAIQKLSIIIYQVRLWYPWFSCHPRRILLSLNDWVHSLVQSGFTPWSCVVNIVHWQLCVMESLHRNYTANNKYCTSLCSYRLLLHGNAEIKNKQTNERKHIRVVCYCLLFDDISCCARTSHRTHEGNTSGSSRHRVFASRRGLPHIQARW